MFKRQSVRRVRFPILLHAGAATLAVLVLGFPACAQKPSRSPTPARAPTRSPEPTPLVTTPTPGVILTPVATATAGSTTPPPVSMPPPTLALPAENQVTNVRFVFNEGAAKPLPRAEGEPTSGAVMFEHRGPGGDFLIGYSIRAESLGAPAQGPRAHDEPGFYSLWSTPAAIPIASHQVATPVTIPLPTQPWPSVGAGRYAALKEIAVPATDTVLYQEWEPGAFEVG